jgi:hypothetical protein
MVQHSTVLLPVLWICIGFNADPDPGFDDLKLGKIEVLKKQIYIFYFKKLQHFIRAVFAHPVPDPDPADQKSMRIHADTDPRYCSTLECRWSCRGAAV